MTGQRITFGSFLDGQRASQPADSLGISVVGPLGLPLRCSAKRRSMSMVMP